MSARRYRRLTPGPAAEATDVAEAAVSDEGYSRGCFGCVAFGYLAIGLTFLLIEAISAGMMLCSQHITAGWYFGFHVEIAALVFAVSYGLQTWFWTETVKEVSSRARPFRWWTHFFALPLLWSGITALLRTATADQGLWIVVIGFTAMVINLAQMGNETLAAAKESDAKKAKNWFDGQWGVEYLIYIVLTIVFWWIFLFGYLLDQLPPTGNWWIPLIELILYTLFFFFILAVVNGKWISNTWTREWLFILFEFLLIAWPIASMFTTLLPCADPVP